MEGLSPRVRGNRQHRRCRRPHRRSIPARAGEPRSSLAITMMEEVYPRACGGTEYDRIAERASQGLSPRVRGNPYDLPLADRSQRSIPARAGEPSAARGSTARRGVYPRACGGTAPTGRWSIMSRGLSPRVRGNPVWHLPGDGYLRSIPARAGEPPRPEGGRSCRGVYPRACGGTLSGTCLVTVI